MQVEPVSILVADDHSLSRQVLRSILASGDYQVASAQDGNEAWEKLDTLDRLPPSDASEGLL
jgi:CheY-like chemotaxis protein